eukprot:12786028-Heterocapsa_arctica.AAC.1
MDGVDIEACRTRLGVLARDLGLEEVDAGSSIEHSSGRRSHNQCFYLAMARSQLGVDPSNARATHMLAERFKSILETCYLEANPGATDQVGGDHMAFAEFL